MNRLAAEKSPYLLQHAGNPVDWFPWGEAAFEKARAEGKPIFLSIGYSTCHWCHVMAHESFEDPAVAALLNDDFISIKVDREERPDVDRVYMAYVQTLTGHGGWPLSVWLTPDLKPFYGGTYFPPEDRPGRAGFPGVLRALVHGWREDRGKMIAEAERGLVALRADAAAVGGVAAGEDDGPGGEAMRAAGEAFERAFHHLYEEFDPVRGGFGGAPKFPRAGNLAFLFRCAALQGLASDAGKAAVRMGGQTLRQMARGGIHDHVGGGFHRYAVDEDWRVPHFEKMLYDQAQIAMNALEAWQATGDERQAWLARDILDYALRDLAAPQGGFFSAEDADSGPEHAEGAFYLWTKAEIDAALSPADAAIVGSHYGVAAEGNVPANRDPHGDFRGKNILAAAGTLEDTAKRFRVSAQEASDRIAAGLEMLRSARARRPRPHRDEKVLAAWNGLMVSALARASVVPAEALADRRDEYLAAAVRTAEFIRGCMGDETRGLLNRSWREGGGAIAGFAEDYAFCIQGAIDLYEADFGHRWLQWAERLQARMDELFWDEAAGGYFNSAAGAADIVVRLKEDYDGAEPAPSSVAASNLLRLGAIFGEGDGANRRARRTIAAFRPRWSRAPQALPQMLCALELALAPPRHVVLAGDPRAADFRTLLSVVHERLGPRRILVALDEGPGRAWLGERAPWMRAMRPLEGRATAYVCEEFACQAPVTAAADLRSLLHG
jgi:uncharacterized protein YyaL (SSP411 family)